MSHRVLTRLPGHITFLLSCGRLSYGRQGRHPRTPEMIPTSDALVGTSLPIRAVRDEMTYAGQLLLLSRGDGIVGHLRAPRWMFGQLMTRRTMSHLL